MGEVNLSVGIPIEFAGLISQTTLRKVEGCAGGKSFEFPSQFADINGISFYSGLKYAGQW